MVRSLWIGLSVIALALTGTAWGQPAAPAPAKPGVPVIKVEVEAGKPMHRCRIVQSWQRPAGGKAYQVQSLETGEMLTLLANTGPSGSGQPGGAASMTIIHWGNSSKPPAGCPM